MATFSEQAPSVSSPGSSSRAVRLARRLKKVAKVGVVVVGSVVGLVVVALAITGLLSADRIEIPPNHLGHYINVKGEKIRYYQTGTGPDILLS